MVVWGGEGGGGDGGGEGADVFLAVLLGEGEWVVLVCLWGERGGRTPQKKWRMKHIRTRRGPSSLSA